MEDHPITEEQLNLLSERLTPLIINNIRDIITIADPEGRIEYISPAVQKLLGYQQVEVIGTLARETYHPEDLAVLVKADTIHSLHGEMFRCRVRHKAGHYIWFETTLRYIFDEKGYLTKIVGVGRDISDRVQAEDELRKTKEQFESLIRYNADAIWMTDTEDIVREVNPSFERMFGWTANEVIGKKLPIIPAFLKSSMENYHERIKSGESIVGLETIRIRKNGSLVDVAATLSPFRDVSGKITGISGVCRDITQRKNVEEELKAKTTLLESFIENNTDSILLFDRHGLVHNVNSTFEKMFGWSQEEILGINYYELPIIPNDYYDEMNQLSEQIKSRQPIIGLETIRQHRNGRMINVLLTSSPVFDGKGEWNGWSITFRDITEWKAAQEQLQNSEKLSLAGQLAAGIAHEIRNPITSIKGFITLMKPSFKEQYYDIVTSEIDRIESIINELLVLAKPQMTKYEKHDIQELIGHVATLLESQAILNNIQFVTDFIDEPAFTYCDSNELKQVFINFIKNAIEAMPNGGTITIQVSRKNGQNLLIQVVDQGCGIPEELLSKIGQPFYTTKENGTGLGFMISKKIIENHSGKIHIDSEIDKGTTINITLPLSD